MPQTLTIRCEEKIAVEIARLARENDVSEEEAARQLVQAGLEYLGS